jgi:hypothetical protein
MGQQCINVNWEGKKSLTMVLLNMWSFGGWGCQLGIIFLLKIGSLSEALGKYFTHIMKAFAFWKVLSFWKVFGLLAFGRTNHNVLGLALTIVDDINNEDPIILPYCKPKKMQTIWRHLHTHNIKTWALETLFLHDILILSFIFVDGKSWKWGCQGWVGWTFRNLLYSMVGEMR